MNARRSLPKAEFSRVVDSLGRDNGLKKANCLGTISAFKINASVNLPPTAGLVQDHHHLFLAPSFLLWWFFPFTALLSPRFSLAPIRIIPSLHTPLSHLFLFPSRSLSLAAFTWCRTPYTLFPYPTSSLHPRSRLAALHPSLKPPTSLLPYTPTKTQPQSPYSYPPFLRRLPIYIPPSVYHLSLSLSLFFPVALLHPLSATTIINNHPFLVSSTSTSTSTHCHHGYSRNAQASALCCHFLAPLTIPLERASLSFFPYHHPHSRLYLASISPHTRTRGQLAKPTSLAAPLCHGSLEPR